MSSHTTPKEKQNQFLCLERAQHPSIDEIPIAKSDDQIEDDRSSFSDWEIPLKEIKIFQELGRGHFGTVHTGHWHGPVVVQMFSTYSHLPKSARLFQFQKNVAICSKARHANVALFVGACTDPRRLAIVTARCDGMSLHKLLHRFKIQLTLPQLIAIATQICRGMSYLHGKEILHKDLRPKNIFVECQHWKVVVTEFGFFNGVQLYQEKQNCLRFPPGWVSYLAPELITKLTPVGKGLEFSKGTDVYAFGTIWGELCCGQRAFFGYEVAAVIWLVGAGLRAPTNIMMPKVFKDILMACWSARAENRPGFGYLEHILGELPLEEILLFKITSGYFRF